MLRLINPDNTLLHELHYKLFPGQQRRAEKRARSHGENRDIPFLPVPDDGPNMHRSTHRAVIGKTRPDCIEKRQTKSRNGGGRQCQCSRKAGVYNELKRYVGLIRKAERDIDSRLEILDVSLCHGAVLYTAPPTPYTA